MITLLSNAGNSVILIVDLLLPHRRQSSAALNSFESPCYYMPIRSIDTFRKDTLAAKPALINYYQDSHHGIVQSTGLLDIPAESLTHITSFLSPPSLLALSRTNRRLNEHINDDNTWYRAFINQFIGIGPENDLENEKILLLRKSERTWRKEFIMRHNLRRFVDVSYSVLLLSFISDAGNVHGMGRLLIPPKILPSTASI